MARVSSPNISPPGLRVLGRLALAAAERAKDDRRRPAIAAVVSAVVTGGPAKRSAGLTVALAVLVARLWRSGEGSVAGRTYLTGLTLTLLASIPFLYHLNLLGFHY